MDMARPALGPPRPQWLDPPERRRGGGSGLSFMTLRSGGSASFIGVLRFWCYRQGTKGMGVGEHLVILESLRVTFVMTWAPLLPYG